MLWVLDDRTLGCRLLRCATSDWTSLLDVIRTLYSHDDFDLRPRSLFGVGTRVIGALRQ